MDEDAYGAFRPTEDARDLGRRHLVDESKHQRPTAIRRQPPERADSGHRGLAPADNLHRIRHVSDRPGGLERDLRPATPRPALVRDRVSGDLEEPDPERR